MDVEDEVEKTVVVVGLLTNHECLALVGEHPEKCLLFCTVEEEVEAVDLAFIWSIVTEVWCATSMERLPLYLAQVLDQAERIGIPVRPCPKQAEQAA